MSGKKWWFVVARSRPSPASERSHSGGLGLRPQEQQDLLAIVRAREGLAFASVSGRPVGLSGRSGASDFASWYEPIVGGEATRNSRAIAGRRWPVAAS